MIIVLEGIDKSGKSTQANLLKERLSKDYKVDIFSFPDYSTRIGQEIKAFLNNNVKYNARTRHLLFSANRWENKATLDELINNNDILILNRYYQSNIVYGLTDNLPLEWLETLDKGLPKEDITIILDIDEQTMRERTDTLDLFESDINKIRNVIRLYRELSKRYGWLIINGNRNKEDINDEIVDIIMRYYK